MTAIDKSSIVASKNAVSCDLAGESVILDMKSGKYFALDDVGTRIWQFDHGRITDFKGTYEELSATLAGKS